MSRAEMVREAREARAAAASYRATLAAGGRGDGHDDWRRYSADVLEAKAAGLEREAGIVGAAERFMERRQA